MTAALSVLVLLAVVGWEVDRSLTASKANTAAPALATESIASSAPTGYSAPTPVSAAASSMFDAAAQASSTDPLSQIGPAVMQQLESAYARMQTVGGYSTATAQQVSASLAPYVAAGVSYPSFTASTIKTDSNTSYTRMLRYRADLRVSLAPLMKNSEPEYQIFGDYVMTKDPAYLVKLRHVADLYRQAASSTALVVVPQDAVSYHIAILNAMEEFAATLDALAAHANDPFASAALLSGYNQAEQDMLTSFNNLTLYYKSKLPSQ